MASMEYQYVLEVDCSTGSGVELKDELDWRYDEVMATNVIDVMSKLETQSRVSEKDLLISEYLGHGIIRLFRCRDDYEKKSFDSECLTVIPGNDTMVCMVFVPTYFTAHDLVHYYIGDEIIYNQVSNFRILKNKSKDMGFNFMVLVKFRDAVMARNFIDEYNGKQFNKIDPERCHVVSVKEIVYRNTTFDSRKNDKDNLPYLLSDPFTTSEEDRDKIDALGVVELPTCPVCLERMDSSTTGLITIPCQHTFHCQCLNKWKNSKCPVCRYSSLRLTRDSLLNQAHDSISCSSCQATENLWMCLICGNVGCGRYNSKHAIQHYDETSHCFAMDLRTQRVWDYAGDNYVHRLVQNEVDGKLVEVSTDSGSSVNRNASSSSCDNKNGDSVSNFMRNKEYHLEYVQVLISQLESQREYYEKKLEECTSSADAGNKVRQLQDELESLKLTSKENKSKLAAINNDLKKQLEAENLVVTGLQENLTVAQKKIDDALLEKEKLSKEKNDLQEQVNDLMFYLQSRDKFENATDEVRDGTIVIQQDDPNVSKTKTKKKKRNSAKKLVK